MKIWPFESIGALGTTVVAKAPRGSGGQVVFQNKSVSWKSLGATA